LLDQTETELAALLAAAIESEAEYPSSLKLLEQIQATEKAARYLLLAIADQRFRPLIIKSAEQLENEREGIAFLRDIAARSAQVQKQNPRASGAGRPKGIVRAGGKWPSALEICALMVGIRWRKEHKRWPGQHNPEAQRSCERLWILAGGPPHGREASPDGALTAWRIHLRAAYDEAQHPVGAFFANIIAPPIPRRSKPSALRRFYNYPRSRRPT
jgi:hypothetical protein